MQENQSRKRKVPQSHDAKFLLDENVLPNFEKFLKSFSFEKLTEDIVILEEDGIVLKKKNKLGFLLEKWKKFRFILKLISLFQQQEHIGLNEAFLR